LWIRPSRPEDRARRATALLVFEGGLDALDRGPDAAVDGRPGVRRIVVDAGGTQPTLDEMLAALFAQRLLTGQTLPAGFGELARYAALLRQGYSPTGLPPEETVEGIFLAIRQLFGADLADEAVAQAFLTRWEDLAARLVRAVEEGTDLFHASLFASGSDFAEEQARLRGDREKYLLDVRRGEQWTIAFPDGPPSGTGLVLRRPRSLLFPYWSRQDRQSPSGEPYLFLAVDWGQGQWVFSTNPVHDLSLRPLADHLQEAEAALSTGPAPAAPWYDGRDRHSTLIAAPPGGSRLSDERMLSIVKSWLSARVSRRGETATGPASRTGALAAAGLVTAALLLAAAGLTLRGGRTGPPPAANLPPGAPGTDREPWPAALSRARFAGAPLKPGAPVTLRPRNDQEDGRQVDLVVELVDADPARAREFTVRVAVNGGPADTPAAVTVADGHALTEAVPVVLRAGNNDVAVSVAGPKEARWPSRVEVSWQDRTGGADLYVLAVGVSRYKDSQYTLKYADGDAQAVVAALARQQPRLFNKVHVYRDGDQLLCNEHATGEAIRRGLHWLYEQLHQPRRPEAPYRLAVVLFAGHGLVAHEVDGEFCFLPYGYDPAKPLGETGLLGSEIKGCLRSLSCPVVLVVDACAAGALLPGAGARAVPGSNTRAFAREAQDAVDRLGRTGRGIYLIAACTADQLAREEENWQHGRLTHCLLQAFDGVGRTRDTAVITLSELSSDIKARMDAEHIDPGQQNPVIAPLNDIADGTIPIAVDPHWRARATP